MGKDDGADMKRRMTQLNQEKKKWRSKDVFEKWKDYTLPDDYEPTKEDMEMDIWEVLAQGIKEHGMPEDAKRNLRKHFDEKGKERLRDFMNEQSRSIQGKDIDQFPEYLQPKKDSSHDES